MKIPKTHPRRRSLETREKLVEGFRNGLVCEEGLIAQGRGEAFDYLLGERTTPPAEKAIEASAALLLLARNPVISVNGNYAALCCRDIVRLSKSTGAKIEVNLFYRTQKRAERIRKALLDCGADEVLGVDDDMKVIPELFSERRRVSWRGIHQADVVLLAMEDGDRTKALVRMGKKVIAIDLNPMSITAKTATITIVDNVIRATPKLLDAVRRFKEKPRSTLRRIISSFDNGRTLSESISFINKRLGELYGFRDIGSQ